MTGLPMMSLRKLEGSLPSPWEMLPFSMTAGVVHKILVLQQSLSKISRSLFQERYPGAAVLWLRCEVAEGRC